MWFHLQSFPCFFYILLQRSTPAHSPTPPHPSVSFPLLTPFCVSVLWKHMFHLFVYGMKIVELFYLLLYLLLFEENYDKRFFEFLEVFERHYDI